ncbi:MAG: DegV family protein [Bacillota bacterium]
MAQHIGFVTDSTADLPAEIAREYDIHVVPLNIHFGDETLIDGLEISIEQFYERFRTSPVLPNTSQPSPGRFVEEFHKLSGEYDQIFSIHISQKMSGTYQSALMAAEMVKDEVPITVIDSQQVSIALAMMLMELSTMAKAGAGSKELLKSIASFPERSGTFFTVSTLEYLERTGRIGKATAFLGQILNIRPLLSLSEGLIIPVERVRGGIERVLMRMLDIVEGKVGNKICSIGIVHAMLDQQKDFLQGKLAESGMQIEKMVVAPVGPVVGSHAGPTVIGLHYLMEG